MKHSLFNCILIFLAILGVFYPAYGFEYINFDDPTYVTENPWVLKGLSTKGILWAFSNEHGGHWHPLSWISHMIDIELFGINPAMHHLNNLIMHALNCVLVYVLVNSLFSSRFACLFIALAFGLHPQRIESVVWISERKDVLSMLFSLLSLIFYVQYVKNRGRLAYYFALIALTLSLLAKPTAIVLPLLFLTLDFYPLSRFSISRLVELIKEKVPFFTVGLLCALAATWAQGSGGGLKSLSDYSLTMRFDSAWIGYLTYLAKFFWPAQLAIFYPFETYQPGVGLGAFIGVLVISATLWFNGKQNPALLFGWLWFVLSLLLVIGFVQIGGQAYADRWSYLPHLGLLIGLVGWCLDHYRLNRRIFFVTLSTLILAVLAGWTRYQLPYWKNSESIFLHTLEVSPRNFMAHTNLGHFYDTQGILEKAAFHYQQAVTIAPNYPVALTNLGSVRARQGRYPEAQSLLLRSLERSRHNPNTLHNLGAIFYAQEKFLSALVFWLRAYSEDGAQEMSKEAILALLKRVAIERCALFRKPFNADTELELRTFLTKWPFPPNQAMKKGLEVVYKCLDSDSLVSS